jgi:DNA-binding GntR family transcriptional regulator
MTDFAKEPAHVGVYRDIRALILSGDLVPGEPVTIQGLVTRLGAGMTPVREAIRRLTSEGALAFHGNRRVTVPVVTVAQVDELILARLALEPELARRAAARAGTDAVAGLEAIDAALNAAIRQGDVRQYMVQNHRFHLTLYRLAGTGVILPIVEMLWLRSAPALRVMCGQVGTRNLPDFHAAALAAMRAGDADGVAAAMRADILQGLEAVRAGLMGSSV